MAKSASRTLRHCRRCPGSPLCSQCIHTQAGCEYLSRQNTSTGQPQDHLANIIQPVFVQPHLAQLMIDPVLRNPIREPFFAPTPAPTPVPGIGLAVPAVVAPPQVESQISTPVDPQGTGTDTVGLPGHEDEMPTPLKTAHATVKNPIHGLVEGVKRGNTKFEVAWQRPLPVPMREVKNSTRRFNRVMRDLVARCERLSAETGCWLYLSGQHVNANLGFYNYVSPRLRREAKAQIFDIQNSSNLMYTSLLNSRRLDAVNLSLQAEKSREELEKAQQELVERDLYIAHLQSELRAKLGSP